MQATSQTSLAGSILTPHGWMIGKVRFQGRHIAGIDGSPLRGRQTPQAPYILPGFIDLHVHGGDGRDYTDGEEGIRQFIRYHAANGTVAIAPTTATAPVAVLDEALANIEAIRTAPGPNEPAVLGAHLEGPFLNPDKLGAQADMPLAGDVALALKWADICHLAVATVAPEIAGGMDVVEALTARGCRVQIGHSLASAEQTAAFFGRGLAGFTHLFNAMSGVDHRHPGVAAYALAHGQYAEIVCDLIHVHPLTLLMAYRSIPRLYAITDATAAAGCADGAHDFGDGPVMKSGQRITLPDGKTLAGSAITMLDAFRNLVSLGLTLPEASELCSTRAADYLGLSRSGRIVPGGVASVIVLDNTLDLQSVWIEGNRIE